MNLRDEGGQVVVLVLGMALLAFAVAGLAVDGTRAWLLRRSLQNAADAAALAGAGELDRDAYYASGGSRILLDEGASESVALRWLAGRGIAARRSVTASENGVTVRMTARMRTTFLTLIGVPTVEVGVVADAAPVPGTP